MSPQFPFSGPELGVIDIIAGPDDPAPLCGMRMTARLRQAHDEFSEYYAHATPAETILVNAVVLLGGVLRDFKGKWPNTSRPERWEMFRVELRQLVDAVEETSAFARQPVETQERMRIELTAGL